jgi:hypothetical protein
MNSLVHGADTSVSEVTSIGPHGFWLLVDDIEYFVPFRDYPVFMSATVFTNLCCTAHFTRPVLLA